MARSAVTVPRPWPTRLRVLLGPRHRLEPRFVRIAAARKGGRLFFLAVIAPAWLLGRLRQSMRWLVYAGYACERAGLPGAAIRCYDRALAAVPERQTDFTWPHVAEFRGERLRHLRGVARVVDPLFDCHIVPAEPPVAEAFDGYYEADWGKSGLQITGLVDNGEAVRIRLDGHLLRTLTVATRSGWGPFNYTIKRSVLARFPARARLTVESSAGRPLDVGGGRGAVQVAVPHGDGHLIGQLAAGRVLDKKGRLEPDAAAVRRHQDASLALYARVRDALLARCGRPLMLMYGTLLGAYRDGDLIPGDDDFDCSYVADATTPEAVKGEAIAILLELIEAGFTISFNRKGRLFRVSDPVRHGESVHLDVHPIWLQDGCAWAHNQFRMPAEAGDLVPAVKDAIRGTDVYLPARPERLLVANYGPGWEHPDPGFIYDEGNRDAAMMDNLARALIRPDEYLVLQAEVEQRRARNPQAGQLISIGSGSMYPLPASADVPD